MAAVLEEVVVMKNAQQQLAPAERAFRVLLVDDEPMIGGLVAKLLAETGCDVEFASTAAKALELVRTRDYHLVLLDVVLARGGASHIDGVSLCRILRADRRFTGMPIYMLTARAKRADIDAAARAGATGYIHKPFTGAELTSVIASLRAQSCD